MKTIFLILIPLISIDLFYFLYRLYKKLELKRINFSEKRVGLEESEYTTIDKIIKKKSIIFYSIGTILSIIYCNFINPTIYESTNFIDMLKTEFVGIFLLYMVYLTLACIFRYLKSIIDFFIGFKRGVTNKN